MSKIETSLLAQQVYQVLRERIIGREYTSGDKLDIYKLADEFGVSRSPVKDAFNQLEHEGLIEIIPRKGTYVTELKLTDFIEILDARLMIESWAAQQTIQTVTDQMIGAWGQVVKEMDSILETTPFSFEQYNQLDMKFHKMMIDWTKNSKIVEIYSSLNAHVSLSRIVHSTSLESTIKRHKDHWHLFEALKNRDLPTLLHALNEHIGSLKTEAKSRW